ncbi:MAG: 1-acyl-sn-glycerol-3-phosphate acyltransferase [Phycisphaerales bacterium]|nr:1-acyl-sn-glycerol-3-phosphate acyltransferase [Phycisphaerales bacterium]
MQITLVIVLALASLVVAGYFTRWLLDNPRGDFETGVLYRLGRAYVKLVHHLEVHGRDHIPNERRPGPLIVVANHTSGVDPLLIQAELPFAARWVMAEDMRAPALEWFWKWQDVIFVGKPGSEAIGLRQAMRHLRNGGVVGIFPEGGIERPVRHILPFYPGLGALVRSTGASVLPVLVEGTPQVDPAWASLWRSSRSRITFGPILRDFVGSPADIAEQIREHFLTWTGWERNDTPAVVDATAGKPPRSARRLPPDELSAA